ncbi:MAG: hypothetical protein MK105_12185 [Crocinitomicaceae bacterium]|nr:hypothetical protein [Crocinitomicaceae bacterium]
MVKKNYYIYSITLFSILFLGTSSCRKSVKHCVNFDKTGYIVGDTIRADASCSEHVDDYLWAPEGGLEMLGNGTSPQENFVILPLSGTLSRTMSLKLTNKKSEKTNWESVIVL